MIFHAVGVCKINEVVGIFLLKVNNRNTRTRCEICSKLTTKTPERRHWCRSGVFIVNFKHISHLVLVSVINVEQVIVRIGCFIVVFAIEKVFKRMIKQTAVLISELASVRRPVCK